MIKALIAGAALVSVSGVVSAQDVPKYDVESHCQEVADIGGGSSNTMYNSCIDMEQSAYDGLKGVWESVPASTREHCDQVASVGGAGSYSLLESCVDMETSAAENKSEFSFD
ncbi:hypothetical protein [Aidingimonas lacisalsi]|uniref:hypothetical protein n=1 Tax=Aidingimonas lacisalsi TaxID=2604086 RepID=UPI0011D250AD|nr:hypothetical protein [Aidingimonas lacisalsi]